MIRVELSRLTCGVVDHALIWSWAVFERLLENDFEAVRSRWRNAAALWAQEGGSVSVGLAEDDWRNVRTALGIYRRLHENDFKVPYVTPESATEVRAMTKNDFRWPLSWWWGAKSPGRLLPCSVGVESIAKVQAADDEVVAKLDGRIK